MIVALEADSIFAHFLFVERFCDGICSRNTVIYSHLYIIIMRSYHYFVIPFAICSAWLQNDMLGSMPQKF